MLFRSFGRIPGILDDDIFDDPSGLKPNILFGESQSDMEGAWKLDKNITFTNMEDFISEAWGNEILASKDNEEDAREWIKNLSNPKNKIKSVQEIQDLIGKYSFGGTYTPTEQKNTLDKILELLESGIDINYTK